MTFFSLEFTLAFFLFFILYWSLARDYRLQNLALLTANYAFVCSFSPFFALVLALHTFFVSYFGLYIAFRRRIDALFFGLFFLLCYLCFFKYFDIIQADFRQLLLFLNFDLLAQNLDLVFPIGISFYSFASVTYLVNIYRQKHAPASFIMLACYLSFFATLLAGPIARSDFMIPQLERRREFGDEDKIFALILLGVIKKVLIANYLQGYVFGVFDDVSGFNSVQILTAVLCYGVWIYCDFSGYVDLVTAMALALGIVMPVNFNMPHLAINLRDFWRRWHISLSTFIRDYIYIPLGGSYDGFWRTQINLLIAFGLSGVWHGVGWGFFVWGLLHGAGVIWLNFMAKFDLNFSEKLPFLARFVTYCFISVTWIYFAKSDLNDANEILLACFTKFENISASDWIWFGFFWIAFFAYKYVSRIENLLANILNFIPLVIKPVILALIFSIVFAVMPDGIPNFIYSSF